MTITNDCREDLYRFIWKLLEKKNCKLLRIGGIPNHIHMLINLHPSVALSTLMRDVKSLSSGWLKSDRRFPAFEAWAKEYFAATLAYKDRNVVIEYIKSQQEHHQVNAFENEIDKLLEAENMTRYDDDFI